MIWFLTETTGLSGLFLLVEVLSSPVLLGFGVLRILNYIFDGSRPEPALLDGRVSTSLQLSNRLL